MGDIWHKKATIADLFYGGQRHLSGGGHLPGERHPRDRGRCHVQGDVDLVGLVGRVQREPAEAGEELRDDDLDDDRQVVRG